MPAKMDAIQFELGSKSLTLIKADVPRVSSADDVVVRVAYSGVCGTDLHIIEGNVPCLDSPIILGHEFCGVVTDVGKEVTHLKIGDEVCVDPNSGCDTCNHCSGGCYHFCKVGGKNSHIGTFHDGGWAQFCLVSARQVFKLPSNITLEQAALIEPLSCISHGWDRIVPVPVGSHILVQGAGIIGNLWASILHMQGHRRVTISEPQQARRDVLLKLETGFQVVHPDVLTAKKAADPDWGFDLVVDCSGFAPAIETALTYIRPGGRLCIFGVASQGARISVPPFLLYKNELTIVGVNINPFSFPKALGLMDALGQRSGKELQVLYSPILLVEFATMTLVFCFSAFVFVAVPLDAARRQMFVMYALSHLAQLYAFCHYGDKLETASLSLRETAFCCGWHEKTVLPETRSTLKVLFHRVQTPLRLSAFGLIALNSETFVNIVRTAISYLMVLIEVLA